MRIRQISKLPMYSFSSLLQYIDTARDLLDTELTAMVGESYQRAYNSMVAVQMLAELEEVIQYKLVPERRQPIMQIWWERLQVGGDWEEGQRCLSGRGRKFDTMMKRAKETGNRVDSI